MTTKKKSGLTTDRAYRIKETMRARIIDIYSRGRHFHATHETILEDLKTNVWEAPELKRCPAWVHDLLLETSRCKLDELHMRDLVWMLALDERLVTSKDVDARTKQEAANTTVASQPGYRTPWQRIDSDHSAHVWVGTMLPFNADQRTYWAGVNEASRKVG